MQNIPTGILSSFPRQFSGRHTNSLMKDSVRNLSWLDNGRAYLQVCIALFVLGLGSNAYALSSYGYIHWCGPIGGPQWTTDEWNFVVNATVGSDAVPGDYIVTCPWGGTVDVRVDATHSFTYVGGNNPGGYHYASQNSQNGTVNGTVTMTQPSGGNGSLPDPNISLVRVDNANDCGNGVIILVPIQVQIGTPPISANLKPNDKKDGGNQCGGPPMALYSAHSMLASLNIQDTPLRYTPPRGPAINFTVTYDQRQTQQPATFTYSNLGPNWTFNWLSYVTDDPNNASANASVYVPGGGAETYSGFNSGSQSYLPDPQSQAVLVRTTSTSYEKRFPDGSKQVFSLSDGSTSYPRKVFMTQWVDAAANAVGLSYDSSFRITTVTDALGQVTTLSYELSGQPLKITKVTEPFSTGRSATFAYNANGQLSTITDEIGIQSIFTYSPDGTNFINSLQTPYGTSNFATGQLGTNKWIEMTDPLGGKERVEYRDNAPGINGSDSVAPSGFTNSGLDVANTFYWDKKAYSSYPDYTKARITHWAYNADGSVSGIAASEKAPLENRVWNSYTGQSDTNHVGPSANPNQVARLLDDGTTQSSQYQYNSLGKMTQSTDPIGRVMSYSYDSGNNIDLLTVRQTTGSNNDLLRTFTYNSLHEPLTDKDAAGQTTTSAYNSFGQITSVQNAKSETTTYSYGPVTGVPAGYLASITSPQFGGSSAMTSFTYDSANRVQTVTNNPDNYTATTIYDNLDRPTQITYPDGTNQQFQYSQDFGQGLRTILDLTKSKDRRGLWTTRHYNANRQMDSITDPLSRMTQYGWCMCGALTSITDPRGKVTTFNRDLQSRVTSKVFDDQTAVDYVYENTTSRLKSMTDALSQTTSYQYFVDDNLKQVSYASAVHTTPTASFTYDPNYNRVVTMVDGSGTTNYSYYPITGTPPLGAGQLQTVDAPPHTSDAITYSYDELGRVLSRSINGVASSVTFDSLGRLNTSDNVLGHFSRIYDGTGNVTPRLKTLTYPNGQTSNYTYLDNSHDRRLQTLQDLTSGSASVSKFDYTYDPEGQIYPTWTKQLNTSNAITSNLTYDVADQLTGVVNTTTGNPPTSFSYGYDAAGNRTSDSTTTYSIDDVNEITNNGYTYDSDGNLTGDGVRGFEWDAANRLTGIVHPGNGGRSEFSYDGLSRRVQITEKDGNGAVQLQISFVWDGSTIVEQRNSTGTVLKRFLPQGVQIPANSSPNSKLFYSRDHLGSIRSLTNENGTLLSTLDYDSYGSISRPPVPANTTSNGPVITGAVSRKTHGSAGTFDVNLPLSGAPGIEMRSAAGAAGNYTLVLTFDRPVLSGTATMASGVGSAGALPAFSGNTATVQLTGVADRQTVTVELDNVVGVAGTTAKVLVAMSVLVGDVNQNGAVTVEDVTLVRSFNSHAIDSSTFRYDVNASGHIDAGDVGLDTLSSGQGASLFPDFAFTGHYYHARSGLYLALYRAYNPSLGRWLSRDPIGEAGGINLYGYVRNQPLFRVDPLGLREVEDLPPGTTGAGYYGTGSRNAQNLAADSGPLVEAGGKLGYGCKGKDIFDGGISGRIEALFDLIFKFWNFQDKHPSDPIKK